MEETFHELLCWRVTHFIWMIAWVREALIHHDDHHSYFVESMRQLVGFHSHFPPLIDADTLVLHTWEEALDDGIFAESLDAVMEAIDGGHMRKRGDILFSLRIFFRTNKYFGVEDSNVPKF